MIWVTWRHHRTSLIVPLGIIAALSITALISGVAIGSDSRARPFGTFLGCFGSAGAVCAAESALTAITVIATMLPVLLGALVGVTVFSRDIEQGTHVLGLTQSVSRARWFWTKVLVVFSPLSVAAALLGLVLEWTRRPHEIGNFAFVDGRGQFVNISNLTYPLFQSSGLVLGACTFMALVLGAAVALLVRSSIGAMALTMAGVIGVLVVFQFAVRPHYAEPRVQTTTLAGSSTYYSWSSDDGPPVVNWEIAQGYVDIRGNFVDVDYGSCTWSWSDDGSEYNRLPDETGAQYDVRLEAFYARRDLEMQTCLQAQGVDHFEIRYHSADQFRRFQITESALALMLSGLFLIPAIWGLRRMKP